MHWEVKRLNCSGRYKLRFPVGTVCLLQRNRRLQSAHLARCGGKVHKCYQKITETEASLHPELLQSSATLSHLSYLAPFSSSLPGKWVVLKLNTKQWRDEITPVSFHLHNWKLLIKLSIISKDLIEFLELSFTVCLAQCEYGLNTISFALLWPCCCCCPLQMPSPQMQSGRCGIRWTWCWRTRRGSWTSCRHTRERGRRSERYRAAAESDRQDAALERVY